MKKFGQFAALMLLLCLLAISVGSLVAQQEYSEAPMLDEMVAAGELPPVADRLPDEPKVVTPVSEIGTYGGTIRKVLNGASDAGGYKKFVFLEPLVVWKPDFSGFDPNVASGWEFSDDGTELTLFLRQGIKWSDGVPFTADDLLFVWEDLWLNEDIPLSVPGSWPADAQLTKTDDYTVVWTFTQPFPGALEILAFTIDFYMPKHYLQQFVAKYNPDVGGIEQFNEKRQYMTNPDLPVISPWVLESWDSTLGARSVRNPYYWKVDTEGNQLPYIDYVDHVLMADTEVAILNIISGDIDLQFRHIGIQDFAVLKENEENGDYQVLNWDIIAGAQSVVAFNTNTPSMPLHDYLRQPDFRRALSIAIDRVEIAELTLQGFGEPWSIGLHPASPYYDEATAKAYTEYDPDGARALLESLGLTDGDGDGILEYSNGDPVTIVLETWAGRSEFERPAELITEHWRAVGVNAILNPEDSTLLAERATQGLLDAQLYFLGEGLNPLADTRRWDPSAPNNDFAPGVAQWYATDGAEGVAPEDYEERLIDLIAAAKIEMDPETRADMIKEIVSIHADLALHLGTVGLVPHPAVIANRVGNVPEMPTVYAAHEDFFFRPDQLYLKY